MFHNRKYKSGTGWCVWRWTDVDSEYITRLHLVKTPWFAVCLHWINKPDPEPYDHDHPVTFLSLILKGWYRERRNGKYTIRSWLNFISAKPSDYHTITSVSTGGALTLCFMGPKIREWGFRKVIREDIDLVSWIGWKQYYAQKRKGIQP